MSIDNWNDFAIDPAIRKDKARAWLGGDRTVNPEGRLTYQTYLGLESLLASQTPGTRIPDERVFIITHQLCELAFKQMLFDIEVISNTFVSAILMIRDKGTSIFYALDDDFWRPALTAAGRLQYASKYILPAAIGYLNYNPDPTFDSHEFGLFREKLIPASGFQSAQFRAVQAALGKRNLLDIQMYPSSFYRKHYQSSETSAAVSPVNQLIVQSGIPFGSPMDDLIHVFLVTLSDDTIEQTVPKLNASHFDPALEKLKLGMTKLAGSLQLQESFAGDNVADRMVDSFRESLKSVIRTENSRRKRFNGASKGFARLITEAPASPSVAIIRLIRSTDHILHGQQRNSFLSLHRRFVSRRIKEVNYYSSETGKPRQTPGTGGGGMPYLDLMHQHLIPLFPALVALDSSTVTKK